MLLNPFAKITRLERENARLKAELSEARAKLAAGGKARGRQRKDRVMAVVAQMKREISERLV